MPPTQGNQFIIAPSATRTSDVTISSNSFSTESGGSSPTTAIVLRKPFESSTFESTDNTFSHADPKSGFGVAYDLLIDSSLVPDRNAPVRARLSPQGDAVDASASIGNDHSRSAAVFDAASSSVDWSTVTDAMARSLYGKSTFKILRNTIAISGNGTASSGKPLILNDNVGCDLFFEENTVTGDSFNTEINYAGNYYPIHYSIRKNKFGADGVGNGYRDTDVTLSALPHNSIFDYSDNVLTTGAFANGTPMHFVSLAQDFPIHPTAKFQVWRNTMVANDKANGPSADAERYAVKLKAALSTPIAVCSNTMFGTELSTDALVSSAIDTSGAVPNPSVIPVAQCSSYVYVAKEEKNAAGPIVASSLPAVVAASALFFSSLCALL